MRHRNVFLWALLIFLALGCKVKEKRAKVNLSDNVSKETSDHLDRPIVNSIVGKYNFTDSLNTKVFLKINITKLGEPMSLAELSEVFTCSWTLQTDYGIKEKLQYGTIELNRETLKPIDEDQMLAFDVPRLRNNTGAVLLIEFIHGKSNTKFSYDLPIDFTATRTNTRFEIYNNESDSFPRFNPYVHVGTPFIVKSIIPSKEKLYLIHYKNNTQPALAPMSGSKRNVLSEFQLIETLEIKDREPIILKEPGMYALTQNPGEINDAFGILVADKRYPRDSNPETLKDAVAYMSTSKEIESLYAYDNPKDAMDMYFLNLAKGDQILAKKIIRKYYQRIEDANKIFTTYKEGWKTDKGMVYTIMGPPAKVQRSRLREVWLYSQNKNTSEIIYTFYRVPNLFSNQNFELVRYPEYSAFWYPYVEAWRTGKVAD